jgi:hypothetical protein
MERDCRGRFDALSRNLIGVTEKRYERFVTIAVNAYSLRRTSISFI